MSALLEQNNAVLRAILAVAIGELGLVRKTGLEPATTFTYRGGTRNGDFNPDEMFVNEVGNWFDITVGVKRDGDTSALSVIGDKTTRVLELDIDAISSCGSGEEFPELAVQAIALTASDMLIQALRWPGNLAVDDRGAPTGMASGMLSGPGGLPINPLFIPGEVSCQLQRWRVSASAVLTVPQAIS